MNIMGFRMILAEIWAQVKGETKGTDTCREQVGLRNIVLCCQTSSQITIFNKNH